MTTATRSRTANPGFEAKLWEAISDAFEERRAWLDLVGTIGLGGAESRSKDVVGRAIRGIEGNLGPSPPAATSAPRRRRTTTNPSPRRWPA